MGKKKLYEYVPDTLITPGEIIGDYIESYGWTQEELARRCGVSPKHISEILRAKAPISSETAIKFEKVLGRSANFWLNMQANYDIDIQRLREQEEIETQKSWIKHFPVREMKKRGYISDTKDSIEIFREILSFLRIASISEFEDMFSRLAPNFRSSSTELSPYSVAVWLQYGNNSIYGAECPSFDKAKFERNLDRIRALSTLSYRSYIPRLKEICRECGVALVIEPSLPGASIYGASKWVGDRTIIQLSLLRKFNDHFWFTFFHEAGHLIRHSKKESFVDFDESTNDPIKEKEADDFAANLLIPDSAWYGFISRGKPTLEEVRQFARTIEIAPGIVIGRLQREDIFSWSTGNRLKEKIELL